MSKPTDYGVTDKGWPYGWKIACLPCQEEDHKDCTPEWLNDLGYAIECDCATHGHVPPKKIGEGQ